MVVLAPLVAPHVRDQTKEHVLTEKSDDAVVAKANLVDHLNNIDIACDDVRLSAVEKIHRIRKRLKRLRTA
jgi:hypothetical protein